MEAQVIVAGVEVVAVLAGIFVLLGKLGVPDVYKLPGLVVLAGLLGGLVNFAAHNPDFAGYFNAVFVYLALGLSVVTGKAGFDKVVQLQTDAKVNQQLSQLHAYAEPLLGTITPQFRTLYACRCCHPDDDEVHCEDCCPHEPVSPAPAPPP